MATTKRWVALWALVALVAIQILAAIWMWWPHQRGPITGRPWLDFSPQTVTRITLADGDQGKDQSAVLVKQGGDWVLPNAHDFPADAAKVEHLLRAVASVKGTLPIAITKDAAERFHVAKDQFETKVTFDVGKKQTAKFYVGNAAGANLVYLRRADSDVIEANQLPSWLVSAKAADWRDKHVLHVPAADIQKLVLPNVTLVRHKDGWTVGDSTSAIDQAKAKKLVKRLAELDFLHVVGVKTEQPHQASFEVTLDDKGKTLAYDFIEVSPPQSKGVKHPKKGSPEVTWRMTRSNLPFVFTVSDDVVKKLRAASVESLSATPSPQKSKQATS